MHDPDQPSHVLGSRRPSRVARRAGLLLAACLAGTAAAQSPRPNIVFVLADDMGWTDLSSGRSNGGHPSDYYRTPHLDTLAAAGVSFDNAYTCGPNCAPTRAALMSGGYAPRTGIYTVGSGRRGRDRYRKLEPASNRTRLRATVVTLAETLHKAGYATGHFGKWHLGDDGQGEGPASQGFDLNVGGTHRGIVSGGSLGHFARKDGSFALPNLPANGKAYQFMADRLTEEAIRFVRQPRKKPFFAYLPHFSVHSPVQAPAADIAAFNGVPKGVRHKNQIYAGMLKNLDDNLGKLIQALETTADPRRAGHKLIENTIVLFTSDNGGVGGYAAAGVPGSPEITSQHPLKSGKGSLYEGGVRVPLIVRWDGHVRPRTTISTPVITVDFYPSLAALAGAPLPRSQPIDGESLVPLLTGKASRLKRTAIFWHFPGYLQSAPSGRTWRTTPRSVVRSGRWKLHYVYETRTFELYDLATDIGESRNLAASKPTLVGSLAARLRTWLVATQAPLPLYKGTRNRVPLPGARTAELVPYGRGCRGSAGRLVLAAQGIPWLGATFQLRVAPLVPAVPAAALLFGASDSVWAGGKLPFDLGPFGMPGCLLLADPAVPAIAAAKAGAARIAVRVPLAQQLAGGRFYVQAAAVDHRANPAGAVTSNGIAGLVGPR